MVARRTRHGAAGPPGVTGATLVIVPRLGNSDGCGDCVVLGGPGSDDLSLTLCDCDGLWGRTATPEPITGDSFMMITASPGSPLILRLIVGPVEFALW